LLRRDRPVSAVEEVVIGLAFRGLAQEEFTASFHSVLHGLARTFGHLLGREGADSVGNGTSNSIFSEVTRISHNLGDAHGESHCGHR
jgi:hypothetical protein